MDENVASGRVFIYERARQMDKIYYYSTKQLHCLRGYDIAYSGNWLQTFYLA
jgi:hypothetical protein